MSLPKVSFAVSWLCIFFQLTCGAPEETNGVSETALDIGPTTLEYSLTWDTSDLSKNENNEWEFTNNVGYPIRLGQGYLVTYSVQLVECPTEESTALKWFNRILGIRTAYAGHPNPQDNPAAIYQSLGENLIEAESQPIGVVEVESSSYCQLHYLVAGATLETASLPDDINLLGTSVYLSGFYQSGDTEEWIPFTIHTPLANGVLNSLFEDFGNHEAEEAMTLNTNGAHLLIETQRKLSGFFEDVNFTDMTSLEMERQILRGIVNNTQTAVTIQTPYN